MGGGGGAVDDTQSDSIVLASELVWQPVREESEPSSVHWSSYGFRIVL